MAAINDHSVPDRPGPTRPDLKWFVSQQPPTDDERVNSIDVRAEMAKIAAADENLIHINASDLPEQEKKLVLDTAGIVRLGNVIAQTYLETQKSDIPNN